MGDGDILRGRCHRDGVRDGGGGPGEEAIDLGKLQKITKNMMENQFVLGKGVARAKISLLFVQKWLIIGQNPSSTSK